MLMLVLGIVLALTGFSLPLGIPMLIFGLIMALTGFLPGILTSIYTFIVQLPIIQNCCAALSLLSEIILGFILIFTAGTAYSVITALEIITY